MLKDRVEGLAMGSNHAEAQQFFTPNNHKKCMKIIAACINSLSSVVKT